MGRPRGSKYFEMAPTGESFGKWTVTGTPWMEKGHAKVECKCECGNKQHVYIRKLVKGTSKQCQDCARGVSPTIGSFSNRAQLSAIGRGLKYGLSPQSLSESFSIQSSSCALSGESLTVENSAVVAYEGPKGLTPDNSLIVSSEMKDAMGTMDAKTFIGLCQVVAENAVPPKETVRKNVSVREFFDRREQQ